MKDASLKSKAIHGVAWNTLNTFLNLGISFVVGIILARLLMPKDYGAVAMVSVFSSVLAIFTDGGLTQALVRKEDRTEADKATFFYYNLLACYLVYGIMFAIAPLIADFYNMPILCKLARVSSLSLLITPFAGIQKIHLTISLDFKKPAFIGIGANIVSSAFAIWMAVNGFGVWSLVIPGLLSALMSTVAFIVIVKWVPKEGFSKASFKNLFGYSSKLLASGLLDRIYGSITPLIVGKFFSPTQLGLYERARGWPTIPSQTFTTVLQSVTFPVLSKIQDDEERLSNSYRRILKISAFIIFPVMVGLAAVAKPLTIVLITEKWLDSVILMQLICFSLMWYPIHAINLNLLTVTGRSGYFLKLEIVKKIWGLIVMICALPFGLVPFCVAGIISSYVSLFINTWYTRRIINFGFIDQLRELLPILANSIIMGTFSMVAQVPFENNVLKLILGVIVGVVYYIISTRFIQKEEYLYTIGIFKQLLHRK